MTHRRTILRGAAGLAMLSVLPLPAHATPDEVEAAIAEDFGDGPFAAGPMTIEVPPLAESGNSVPLTVTVDSPMTAEDRITRIAMYAEGNPRPRLARVAFGAGAARASLATNIRLNGTQTIHCIAETGDGRLWRADRVIRVVVGACTTLDGQY